MIDDHYSGAARRWAEGASIVYGPIVRELVATAPHALSGRRVLDVGAGTGVATTPLEEQGARVVAVDLSHDMLTWNSGQRPPSAVADVRRLPLRDRSADDVIAAFVLNHLADPVAGFSELMRVTRPAGAVLACVYANASRSEVRDAIDAAAQAEGWTVPEWYTRIKAEAVPLLGTAESMARVATEVGLGEVAVDERPVDVGVTEPEQLVDYRIGQAHVSAWIERLDPDRAAAVRDRMVEAIRPMMRPYQPIVVFVSGRVRGVQHSAT